MNESLIEYYVNLLIIQYYNKTKARDTIMELITAIMVYDISQEIRNGFDITTAVGTQLDLLAKYVGVERVVTGAVFDRDYFGFADYTETAPFTYYGYIDYTDITSDIQFRNYVEENKSLYGLIDTELRMIITMKIIQNNGNASNKEIDDLLNTFFGSEIIFFERYPMGVTYIFPESKRRLTNIAKTEGVLPHPAAVGLTISFVNDITSIFGYKKYGVTAPTYIIGYKKYGVAKTGGWGKYGEA